MPIVVNGQVYKAEHIITEATPKPILGAVEPAIVEVELPVLPVKETHEYDVNLHGLSRRSNYMNDMLTSK